MNHPKPTKEQLLAAVTKTVPDVVAPGLKLVFCGINPGLYTAWSGNHFGRPGNRFWKALYTSGFTDRLLHPSEQHELLKQGYGITNVVSRTTNAAAELSSEEFIEGGKNLAAKLHTYKPKVIAFLGVEAYRKAFNKPKAQIGKQEETIAGVIVWVLPNPSGLNAHYTPAMFTELFTELRVFIETLDM